MSESQPSNAVLASKLDSLKELMEVKFATNEQSHKDTNEHLKKLNGQVIKNTKFRWQTTVYGGLVVLVIPLIVSLLINKYY